MIVSAVIIAAVVFILVGLFFVSMYVIKPRKTMVIVTWPDGREKVVSAIIGFGGRATWRISFVALTISAVIRTIDVRKMACFFWDFRKR